MLHFCMQVRLAYAGVELDPSKDADRFKLNQNMFIWHTAQLTSTPAVLC
jgi:hypothetical protein